jgi:hypothetical protein
MRSGNAALAAWLLLAASCGGDDTKGSKGEPKDGIALAAGTAPTLPAELKGVTFNDPLQKALDTFRMRDENASGTLDGFHHSVNVKLHVTGDHGFTDSATKDLEINIIKIEFPVTDPAKAKEAFQKAWGPGEAFENHGVATTRWRNPAQQLEARLWFPRPNAVELDYERHLELTDVLPAGKVALPPQFDGLALGQNVDDVKGPWKGSSGLKQRYFGRYALSMFDFERRIKSCTVRGLEPETARAEIEKLWGPGTPGKGTMDVPIVVWTNPEAKLKAELDNFGVVEFEPL